MRRVLCAAGGLVGACIAAYCLVMAGSIAGSAMFDTNALARSAKADRLPLAPAAARDDVLMAFHVPSQGMTVVARGQIKSQIRPQVEGAMQAPRKDEDRIAPALPKAAKQVAKQQARLPEGCEPSFSPVTVPALANVPGRCLS